MEKRALQCTPTQTFNHFSATTTLHSLPPASPHTLPPAHQLAHDDDSIGAASIANAAAHLRDSVGLRVDPDVIMINGAFWDLHDLGTNSGVDQQQMIISSAYLQRWMGAASKTLRAVRTEWTIHLPSCPADTPRASLPPSQVRAEWPTSHIVWHTAPQTRTELETGEPGAWHKEWAFKMHIAQINAAARHVAR